MANEKRRLIDANAFIKELDSFIVNPPFAHPATPWHRGITLAAETALRMPPVDAVEVVHGRWIDDGGLDEDGNGQYRCSSCGVGEKHNPTVTVSYCWNCGAKMDGDGNG